MKIQKLNKGTVWTVIAGFFAAALAVLVCYFLKDEVLGCHDSFEDFIYAQMHTTSECFHKVLNFNLARGRVGFLSALVMTIRYIVLGTGNYTAVWLLQQVPIWLTVFLISWMVAKKTHPVYGIIFAAFFSAFLQIDNNHSLMVCYPMDFMYGMSLMALGLFFYDKWLTKLKEKGSIWFLILSLFFYYESMTVYEPFITAAVPYAFISIGHACAHKDELGEKAFPAFIVRLVPHALTAVLFMGILNFIKSHPIVSDVEVTAVDEYGSLHDFLDTWGTFTTSLFPLSGVDRLKIDIGGSIGTLTGGGFLPVFTLCAVASVAAAFMAIRSIYTKLEPQEQKQTDFTLLIIGMCGASYALFFTAPHALTYNYQMWVEVLGATGYLTSSMCYFGWALMCASFLSILFNYSCRKGNVTSFTVMTLASLLFFFGAELTVNINTTFKSINATTGQKMSYRAQVFYSFFKSDYARNESSPEFVFLPGYIGIHDNIEASEMFADYETSRDMAFTNDLLTFNTYYGNYNSSGLMIYDVDSEAGWFVTIDNPYDAPEDWTTSSDIVFISSRPDGYEFIYEYEGSDEEVVQDIDAGRMEVYEIPNDEPVDVDSLTILLR